LSAPRIRVDRPAASRRIVTGSLIPASARFRVEQSGAVTSRAGRISPRISISTR
jgi:hypothetical protein